MLRFTNISSSILRSALGVILAVPAIAGTIVSTDTGSGGGWAAGDVAAAAGWSQTSMYSNVTITAEVDPGSSAGDIGTAFLMTKIGPGTTVADQIATTNFTATGTAGTYMLDTLFTGLTLGPGSYYLVLESANYSTNGGMGWELDSGTPVTGSGVTLLFANANTFPATTPGSYVPAMNFSGSIGGTWDFSVTSEAGSASPEPGSFFMLATGAAALFLVRRKRVL
jgi:hypothetical protein